MIKHICVIGGTGFIGTHLVRRLADAGYQLRVVTRQRKRHKDYIDHPNVKLVEADVYSTAILDQLFSGSDCIINLVGILNETGSARFKNAHVELPRDILTSMQTQGVRRLLHMSALNADPGIHEGEYLRSKGEAEELVMNTKGIDATAFRPSVVFGQGDSFFNRFASLLRLTPLVFPLACPNARFAPVFVDDVVEAFVYALENNRSIGKRYDLCGPDKYTLRELVQFTARCIGVTRLIIGLPDFLSRLQARLFGLIPGKPFSMDNYYSLQKDSVCKDPVLTELGITPHSVEEVVPGYLARKNNGDRYQRYRIG